MSEELNIHDYLKFKSTLTFSSESCLSYIRKQNSNEVFITFSIPYEILIKWHQIKVVKKLFVFSYVDLLFLSQNLPSCTLNLKEEAKLRLEARLRELSYSAAKECTGTKGATRVKILKKVKKLAVYQSEIEDASQLLSKINSLEEEKKELQEQLETLEAQCDSLVQEVAEFRQTTQRAADLEQSYSEISNQNDKLKEYVDALVDRDSCKYCDSNYRNNGCTYNEVSYTQKQRKLKVLKTNSERALWFLESFGFELDKLFLSDCQTGEKVTLRYNNEKKSAYQFLSDEDKDKVRNVVYIMDKFCVSDAAYHEFSMTNSDGLPRSYLIKQCRQDLNKVYSISRTPGEWPGAQLSFKDELNHQLSKQMEKLGDKMLSTQRVKISGDGAKMSRITNFVVLSFSLLSEGEKVMSTKGIHTVAILNGKEDYGVLQTAGKNLFKEINDLIATREITVDGKRINLEFYLGGDYKFLLTLLGMNAANSIYACIYCKVASSERWDMSKAKDFYWSDEMVRTIEEIQKCALQTGGEKFGCIHPPLIRIPLCNVVPDELHLMLRITDKLEKNLIHSVLRRDKLAERGNQRIEKNVYQHKLLQTIKKCGVTFSIWNKPDENGNLTDKYDWTSLMGADKKTLLYHLPDSFAEFVSPDNLEIVTKIWKDFQEVYGTVNSWSPSEENVEQFFSKATEWLKLFLTLGGIEDGYKKANVTPYMHILCYHVPFFLATSGVKCFTGQGVEKVNDVIRRLYHQKSNKYDACTDGLQAVKRLDDLQDFDRKPRSYKQRDASYWNNGIIEERQKRPRLSVTPLDDDEENVDKLSEAEVKAKLKEMGIKTRVKNAEKLRQLLKDIIFAAS